MDSLDKPKRRRFSRLKVMRWIASLSIGAYFIFCIWFYRNQESRFLEPAEDPTGYEADEPTPKPSEDKFLSPPNLVWAKQGPSPPNANELDVKINFQKFDARREPVRGTVFYLHGNRGNIDKCRFEIKPFLDAGYDVWTHDYRTFGDSQGALSEVALLSDAQMVYKHLLTKEGVEEKDLVVWGRSFGSGIAAHLAAHNSPKMLVLETPYYSLPDAACHSRPYLLSFLFRYRLPTHIYLDYVECPVHLIHGTLDEKIPFTSSKRLLKLRQSRNLKVEKHWIEGGDHNLRPTTEFRDALTDILR